MELLQREERHSKLGSTVAEMELQKQVMVSLSTLVTTMEESIYLWIHNLPSFACSWQCIDVPIW